jgi:hypothetical protein
MRVRRGTGPGLGRRLTQTAIHLAAVANADDQNQKPVVVKLIDDAVVAVA